MKVSIKVTSDFICPWCRIAEARLEKARQSLPEDVEVEVDWLPIELNPGMPRERRRLSSWKTWRGRAISTACPPLILPVSG